MTDNDKTIWTVARIAKHLRVDRHRVEYVIDSRGIEPIGRAGVARVYDRAAVNRIASELSRIDTLRESGANWQDGGVQ